MMVNKALCKFIHGDAARSIKSKEHKCISKIRVYSSENKL